MKKRRQNGKIIKLLIILIFVLVGGIMFVGAVGGWFGTDKIIIDKEYYSEEPELMDLDVDGYDELLKNGRSFIIFVDQAGCTTADKLRGYIKQYMDEQGASVYKMMFDDVKESSLHEYVRYYPSVVIVSRGKVGGFLRADSDDDADAYNSYEAFLNWMEKYLK